MSIDPKEPVRRAIRSYFAHRERLRHAREIAPYRHGLDWLRRPKRDGVLLCGYVEVGFGLGQVIRGLARGLDAVGEPFAIHPYRVNARRGEPDQSWVHRYDVDGRYPINVLCMARNQTELAFRVLGRRRLAGAYNILSTFWELSSVPPSWRADLERFDEIWAPNTFVADALRPHFDGPITIIPTAVTIDGPAQPAHQQFHLDQHRRWFLVTFDYNAFAERKHPLAAIRAFAKAFPRGDEPVGLIVKSNGASDHQAAIRDAIAAAATQDHRIRVIHAELTRDGILALMASADFYVSLHRAEGFGYGMAEAMLLGKPVIATGYSGNMEFTSATTAFLVPFARVAIPPGAYPDADGAVWAEPDVTAAAELMRQVIADPGDAQRRAEAGRTLIATNYGASAVGSKASARLAEIRALLKAKPTRR